MIIFAASKSTCWTIFFIALHCLHCAQVHVFLLLNLWSASNRKCNSSVVKHELLLILSRSWKSAAYLKTIYRSNSKGQHPCAQVPTHSFHSIWKNKAGGKVEEFRLQAFALHKPHYSEHNRLWSLALTKPMFSAMANSDESKLWIVFRWKFVAVKAKWLIWIAKSIGRTKNETSREKKTVRKNRIVEKSRMVWSSTSM